METQGRALLTIRSLLSEPLDSAGTREKGLFESILSGTDGSVVISGAGRLGRMCRQVLESGGIQIRAFCDRSPALVGKTIDGVPVISPEMAAARFGRMSLFVMAVWSGPATDCMTDRSRFFSERGCNHLTTFAIVFWALGSHLLPFHSLEMPTSVLRHRDSLLELADVLEDEASRTVLAESLERRLWGRFPECKVSLPQYFPSDLISPIEDETFIDAGAYTGDTLGAFMKFSRGKFGRYVALEPDPTSRTLLEQNIDNNYADRRSKIDVLPIALYSESKLLRFKELGSVTSVISGFDGTIDVQASRLDDLKVAEQASFIKLDIEGAEPYALAGGVATLQSQQPIVAICVYHNPDDLWKLPLELKKHLPDHALFLRQHGNDGWETVCYSIPRSRLIVS